MERNTGTVLATVELMLYSEFTHRCDRPSSKWTGWLDLPTNFGATSSVCDFYRK
jgi:hypothetical protein